jgi:hypothetical protein
MEIENNFNKFFKILSMTIALTLLNLASPRIPNMSIEIKCIPMIKI